LKLFSYKFLLIASVLLFAFINVQAQYQVQGTIYDSSRTYPLEAVSVLSTSGKGTISNTNGYYQIEVSEQDSIYFSYLGKPTVKFPVKKIVNITQFDLALRVCLLMF
jgi:vancomycin permeability regulator SanA